MIVPLAGYPEQLAAETAAFDLAHAAAKRQEVQCIADVARHRPEEPVAFDTLIEAAIKVLVYDAVEWSTAPEPGKCEIAVRRTELDQIFVVTFPEADLAL